MEKKTISIEEIKNNPNLDLTDRIQKYLQDGKWNYADSAELAVASIKKEYEYLINNRTNVSPNTDSYLEIIKNGGLLSNAQLFEMVCDDPKKVEAYAKYDSLNQRVNDNNGITKEDLEDLLKQIGFDKEMEDEIRTQFEREGKIIESYNR